MAIQRSSFKDLYDKYHDAGSPYLETMQRLTEKFNNPLSTYYLIILSGQIIGFSRVLTNQEETEAWQGTIAILPDYQGKGYGRVALKLIEAEHSDSQVWGLNTILQEEHLVRLYESLGYRKEKTETVQRGMDLVFMEKRK